jgi:hypothetical protein
MLLEGEAALVFGLTLLNASQVLEEQGDASELGLTVDRLCLGPSLLEPLRDHCIDGRVQLGDTAYGAVY